MPLLNRKQVLELNDALSSKGLKTKHVSGENYIKVLNLKIKLKNCILPIAQAEKDLAEEMGLIFDGQFFSAPPDKKEIINEFQKKITEIHKAFSVDVEFLNFIPIGEMKLYCNEQDTSVEATLFEYLLLEQE